MFGQFVANTGQQRNPPEQGWQSIAWLALAVLHPLFGQQSKRHDQIVSLWGASNGFMRPFREKLW